MRLLADSGGIIAALNEAEPGHVAFREVLEAGAAVYITPLVVTEVHHVLVSYGLRSAADDFLGDVAGGFYELFNPVAADYSAARELAAQYQGLVARKRRKRDSLDLADAMNVVAAGRLETNLLVATDQDYRTVRPLSRHPAFVLLPLDG
ncbi:MAG: PIN domain-containing protein [Propionibacteriaceae bacterium]|jgi:predicted nucleic acid-binding protein|nr:PIN domain-containing protein [Propionibacteriaceae bacterium]